MLRRLPKKVSFAAIVLFSLHFATAHGQDGPLWEYRPVLEITDDALAAGLSDGWRVVEGNDVTAQSPTANTGQWQLETNDAGGTAVSLTPGTRPLSLVSPLMPLEEVCIALLGVILGRGENDVTARLMWISGDTVLHEEPLFEPPVSKSTYRRFNLAEAARPDDALAAQIVLTAYPKDGATFHCTNIQVTGMFSTSRDIALFYNRIGYEQVEPKFFTVRANFTAHRAVFALIDSLGNSVYNGDLSPAQSISGANGIPWGGYYYRGDFSAFQEEGKYMLRVTLDRCDPVRAPVYIGFNSLWDEAFALTLAPFKQLRVANSNTGGALQLWDAAFSGGASDASLLWDIVRSCSILQGRFREDPAYTPLREEALYGLERLAQWIISGGIAANQEEQALYAATLACGARMHSHETNIMAAAQLMAEQIISGNLTGALPFSAVMDMYELTEENHYLEYAQRIFPGISAERIEPLLAYEDITGEMVTINLSSLLLKLAEPMAANAGNPFGLAVPGSARGGFFMWDADAPDPMRGNSARILAAVEIMAQAYRYATRPAFRTFAYDQFNWLMGNNPYGACLIVGLCESDAPPIALPDGMTLDDAYGAVLHGIGPCAADNDIPCFGLTEDDATESTNGFSLYNNARYISAMAYLKRIHVARP